jgi:hypothetical protein
MISRCDDMELLRQACVVIEHISESVGLVWRLTNELHLVRLTAMPLAIKLSRGNRALPASESKRMVTLETSPPGN